MEKYRDKKLKRSAAKEHRVNLIALEIRRWDILRYYRLHKMYTNLAEDLSKDIMVITQETPSRPTIYTDTGRLTLEYFHKGWKLELMKNFNVFPKTEILTELIWDLVDTADGRMFRHKLQSFFPKPPNTFYHTPDNWMIQLNSSNKENVDEEKTKIRILVQHLGSMLLAYALQDKNVNHQTSSDSVYDQIRSFVAFGDVIYDKLVKVDLNNLKLPGPLVSLGENMDSLIIMYSKFCNKCGGRLGNCYCQVTSDDFNHKDLALSTNCWTCSQKMIKRALLHDFNTEFNESECKIELDEYMETYLEQAYNEVGNEYWVRQFGDWLLDLNKNNDKPVKLIWKKLDIETVERLMEDVISIYSEYYDGEPGEDECSCPTWWN